MGCGGVVITLHYTQYFMNQLAHQLDRCHTLYCKCIYQVVGSGGLGLASVGVSVRVG